MLASDLPNWFVRLFAFGFGAIWGSFANVVIYRWPRELSVVHPGSHCFACKRPVRPVDNVPILAWLWLRGRCRDCGARFSPRYAVVELLFALVSTAIAERVFFGGGAAELSAAAALGHYAVRFCVAFALLVATFIDLDEMIVPWFVKWFAPVPLLGAWLLPPAPPAAAGLLEALWGAALGYLGLRILFIDGYKLLTGRRGMGLGDAEILLLVGALLGPAGVAFALGAGAVQGVIATLVAMALRRRLGPAHADEVEDDDDGDNDVEALGADTPEAAKAATQSDGDAAKAATQSDGDAAPPAEGSPDRPIGAMKVPFVPFLALGALEYLLGADALVAAYLRLMRGE